MKRGNVAIPLLTGLLALLAGCSGAAGTATTSTSPAATSGGTANTSGGTSATSAATHSAQLTGTRLATVLVPGSAFPHGFRYDDSTSFDSGSSLEISRAHYKLTTVSCANFSNNFGRTGFGETAVAGNSYGTLAGNYTAKAGGAYDQMVYQFASTSAARSFYGELRSIFARCPGGDLSYFTGSTGSITQQFSDQQVPGAQAFRLDITSTIKIVSPALVTRVKMWIAVAGRDVFEVDAVGFDRQVPASPTPKTVMTELIARVLAA